MRLPEPKPGLVIRYSFLWSHERQRGATEGAKDRPSAIVLVQQPAGTAATVVSVLPITHAPPTGRDPSRLKLTPQEGRGAGLDDGDHWVVLGEVNRFTWPGYDLRRIPGTDRCDYGRLSQQAFSRIVAAFKALDAARKAAGRPGPSIDRDG